MNRYTKYRKMYDRGEPFESVFYKAKMEYGEKISDWGFTRYVLRLPKSEVYQQTLRYRAIVIERFILPKYVELQGTGTSLDDIYEALWQDKFLCGNEVFGILMRLFDLSFEEVLVAVKTRKK